MSDPNSEWKLHGLPFLSKRAATRYKNSLKRDEDRQRQYNHGKDAVLSKWRVRHVKLAEPKSLPGVYSDELHHGMPRVVAGNNLREYFVVEQDEFY